MWNLPKKEKKSVLPFVKRSQCPEFITPKLHLKRMLILERVLMQVDEGGSEENYVNLVIACAQSLGEKSKVIETRCVAAVQTIEMIYSTNFSNELRTIYSKAALFGAYAGILENSSGDAMNGVIHPDIWNALIIYTRQLKDKYPDEFLEPDSLELLELINYVGYFMGRNKDMHIGNATKNL